MKSRALLRWRTWSHLCAFCACDVALLQLHSYGSGWRFFWSVFAKLHSGVWCTLIFSSPAFCSHFRTVRLLVAESSSVTWLLQDFSNHSSTQVRHLRAVDGHQQSSLPAFPALFALLDFGVGCTDIVKDMVNNRVFSLYLFLLSDYQGVLPWFLGDSAIMTDRGFLTRSLQFFFYCLTFWGSSDAFLGDNSAHRDCMSSLTSFTAHNEKNLHFIFPRNVHLGLQSGALHKSGDFRERNLFLHKQRYFLEWCLQFSHRRCCFINSFLEQMMLSRFWHLMMKFQDHTNKSMDTH